MPGVPQSATIKGDLNHVFAEMASGLVNIKNPSQITNSWNLSQGFIYWLQVLGLFYFLFYPNHAYTIKYQSNLYMEKCELEILLVPRQNTFYKLNSNSVFNPKGLEWRFNSISEMFNLIIIPPPPRPTAFLR